MSFLSWAALAVGVLVVVPLVAHLLRRRPPDEENFAATRFVPERTAVAQRRTAVEDRALFAVRALAIAALAILGASPFVTCSRLSLARQGGASVALAVVLDDSLSMRAAVGKEGDDTRFERARSAALELLDGLERGDAVSVILAGEPPRVALAATTNLDAARATLESAVVTDRGTEVVAAVQIAGELLGHVEHVDKRIVVLSDMARGGRDGAALRQPEGTKLWVPLDDIRGARADCGVVRADRSGVRVSIRVACTPGYAELAKEGGLDPERRIEVRVGERTLVDAKLRVDVVSDLTLRIPEGNGAEPVDALTVTKLTVALTGKDAVAVNDVAPIVSLGGQLNAGLVSDPTTARPPTGGPPMVEQVVAALKLNVQLRPLLTVPDRAEDIAPLSLLVADDIPGFTPGQRRDVAAWVKKGGVLLLAFGPAAAHAPLGSGFSPMLEGLVRWTKDAKTGVERESDRFFGASFDGLEELAPKGRAKLDLGPDTPFEVMAKWADGAPFLLRRKLGRGVVLVLTLPLDPEQSDFTLRLGFVHLMHDLVTSARVLVGTARTPVGETWVFDGFRDVVLRRFGPGDTMEPIEIVVSPNGHNRRASPDRLGLYELALDDSKTTRVAAMSENEVDTRPREIGEEQQGAGLGGVEASVDISHYIAIALLALMLAELIVRVLSPRWRSATPGRGDDPDDGPSESLEPAERDAV